MTLERTIWSITPVDSTTLLLEQGRMPLAVLESVWEIVELSNVSVTLLWAAHGGK